MEIEAVSSGSPCFLHGFYVGTCIRKAHKNEENLKKGLINSQKKTRMEW